MTDYTLYYWSAPFRGQFVRAVLAWAGKTWAEAGDEQIGRLMEGPVKAMPVPFMGPPVLVDEQSGFAVSQMPAILLYLGESLALLPEDPAGRALALKVVCDANDVIDELTRDGGKSMWTPDRWTEFEPRLTKWMSFWEEIGRRHGLKAESGLLLGGDAPGLADIVTATLWTTIADRFPQIGEILKKSAPRTAALAERVSGLPPLVAVAEQARRDYGDTWSGGQIEASLRKVLKA
ncbi:glutathione S-transferase [Brevundimonas goettingensis]|uniref:Glutathione S-transferase n=1 Tax=Brevundimonas goettingensis TaxID=2774190 RepID=A0A975GWM9_9CAUL|nr:glutathione S-transferase [Brevundimonas goettingensis]QTC92033.1 glutathione S-transferase [Brevundimonas goettingensis]